MPVLDQLPTANPPAIVRRVSQAEASKALTTLKSLQLGTPFVGSRPSDAPGLVTILLPGGKVAYSDISGRYYIVGVVFDLETGKALDGALDGELTEK
jgi:hypothetical protein